MPLGIRIAHLTSEQRGTLTYCWFDSVVSDNQHRMLAEDAYCQSCGFRQADFDKLPDNVKANLCKTSRRRA